MDVIILTAAIPGAPPPKLMSKDVVNAMKPGSVIVDIAASGRFAEQYKPGDPSTPWPGNCELTRPGESYKTPNGVTIVGFNDLPNRFAKQATDFYANCLLNLIEDMCFKGCARERGSKGAEVGTAEDFKVDMAVLREQTVSDDKSSSYFTGTYAVGDDVMAGMVVVKLEGSEALIDFPKPPPKPMMTAQAVFENTCKTKRSDELIELQAKVDKDHQDALTNLEATYKTKNFEDFYQVLDTLKTSEEKIRCVKAFENCKDQEGYAKSMDKLIKNAQAEEAKEKKASASGGAATKYAPIIGGVILLGCFALMAFGPAPELFIGNVMVFILASFLGYHLITEVKASLYTPLMSMSNAISGIVIVAGMLQVQGEYLWPEMGTPTQILGAVAVAVSAVNIAGGFAVTFRMLAMFKKSD